MPISSSDFNVSISPSPIRAVIGMTSNFNLLFSNTSLVSTGYNLTVEVTIPNGVSYVNSDVPATSITNNLDGTITLVWQSIKDLAPNELNFPLTITLKADETFRISGLPVPFDIPINSVNAKATVDTLPRGNDDAGNVKITKNVSSSFLPLRYWINKLAPAKMPKGAGLLIPVTSPLWKFTYTLTLENNSREPSIVTLIDTLPNGVRYLDTLSVVGDDDIQLSSPTIIYPSSGPSGSNFTTINWGQVTLSASSINVITFYVAIWNNYTSGGIENSGSRIPHLTPLTNTATLNGLSGPVQATSTTNAMDLTIDKFVTPSSTEVGQINNYTLLYRVNQYDALTNVVITDILSDAQTYNVGSASIIPVNPNPPRNLDGTTTLSWNIGSLPIGYSNSITFSSTTSTLFLNGKPVSAFDSISNSSNINGTNATFLTATPDTSDVSQEIFLPNINKKIIDYYYKDGTVKPFDVAAPGDLVKFEITYSSIGLDATQLGITIDDYPPLNMGPLTNSIPVTYGGTLTPPFPLVTVSPNGLRWTLGTVPANSLWTATFSVPVANIDFIGTRNNLAKLAGVNTAGLAYSDLSLVPVSFGQPNVSLNKSVTGPNTSAIKAGEIYTYSITISNPQNSDANVTDAFQMDLTDVIPTDLLYNGTYSVTGTGTYTTPVFSGQNVSMTILKLGPGQSLTFNYDIKVSNSVVSGKSYVNTAILQRPYSQPDRSYQFPGAPFTSSTTLKALGITLSKLVAPIAVKIGDIATYILQVTVPVGTTAYNVKVTDTFTLGNQSYIANSATKDGLPITPSISGNIVTFPAIPFIDATLSAVTILYSFDVRVINGTHVSPFIESQTDYATVSWDFDNIGTPATPFNTSAILQVRTPNLTARKEQRNTTTNPQHFTTSNLSYLVGDIIQYRLTVTNTGAETAYNSIITDTLSNFLSYNTGTIATTNGTASISGNLITWNITTLASGASATLTFNVTTLVGIGSGATISNNATFSYNTNDNGFGITYGPTNTNTVRLTSQTVTISKIASITQGEIGDDINYTITFTVPYGTIAYSPVLTDTLPVGQSYIGPTTRQVNSDPPTTVIPSSISGQLITFPTQPDINASSVAQIVTYKFIARITSATHNPPFNENQTNSSNINWGSTAIGNRINRSSSVTINARTPNIIIKKEQKNVTTSGSYTTSNISAIPGDVIYYRLTVTSNGASPAYNVVLTDLLDNKLTFENSISGIPTPTVVGQLVTWTIPQLNNGSTATYEFQVSIKPGISAGDIVPNTSNATYDSNDVNPISYSTSSNTTNIDIPLISFDKTVSTSIATIGSQLDYTLTVTIPNGVSVASLAFTDVIPSGQTYITSSFTGTPLPTGSFFPAPNQLIYLDSEPSRTGPLTLIYNFSTTVVSGTTISPYTEVQKNICDFDWLIKPSDQPRFVSDFADVTINVPKLSILKEQRLLPNGVFTTSPLVDIQAGDTVEYKLTVTNIGTFNAYDIVTTDLLNSDLSYAGVTNSTAGNVSELANTVTWTINTGPISPSNSETLIFKVNVDVGPAPGTNVTNNASSIYKSLVTNTNTLGPSLSNTVAFNYNPIEVDKTVEKNALFVGDTVNYTVKVTVPYGNIAYNVEFIDLLPNQQTYDVNSLKLDGFPITPVAIAPLTAPTIPVVDASSFDVTLTYTFTATINSINILPQEAQVNTGKASWTLKPEDTIPVDTIVDTATVYVTNNTLDIQKYQSASEAGPFTKDPISTSVGSIIYYKLQVTNHNPYTLYNVISTDTFSSNLQILSFTIDFGSALLSGNNFTWTIDALDPATIPLTTYTATIKALVLSGEAANSTINNLFNNTFSLSTTTPNVVYGPLTSNNVTANLPALEFNKFASKTEVQLGEIITYILSVTIPKGVTAYNVVVSDVLPPEQIYIGNASINNSSVTASQVGQTITFPTQNYSTPSLTDYVVEFKFDARVVEGNDSEPFTEIQVNNAKLQYTNEKGDPAPTLYDTLDITVNSPELQVVKSQRNVTQNTGFRTIPISINVNDVVRYRLEITNIGASPSYVISLNDILNPFDSFISIFFVSKGTPIYNNLTRTITWTIDSLEVDESCELLFDVICEPGVGAGGYTSDIASYSYNTNSTTPITVGPLDTNEVIKNYPSISIEKMANKTNYVIGQIVTYDIYFKVPLGTIAYNVQVSDTLHVGQQYNDNLTLNGSSISGETVNGQLISFPLIPFLDATKGEIIYHYTFESLITTVSDLPPTFIEVQNNTTAVNWSISPTVPAIPVAAQTTINVTNSSIQLSKLQRNVSKGESFTANPISAYNGQTIEYAISVINNGPNTVYNVNVTDILSNLFSFILFISFDNGAISHIGGSTNGTILWTFTELKPGETGNAVFSIKLIDQPSTPIENFTSGSFTTVAASKDTFESDNSNIVILNPSLPFITITNSSVAIIYKEPYCKK